MRRTRTHVIGTCRKNKVNIHNVMSELSDTKNYTAQSLTCMQIEMKLCKGCIPPQPHRTETYR